MKKACAWLPALLWMGLIYLMSAMPGDVSGAQSGMLTEMLLSFLSFLTGGAVRLSADVLHLLIRKGCHMAEYAVLALLCLRALRICGAAHAAVSALAISVFYAAGDEFHQGFVAGRGPSPVDVCIDALGAVLALLAARAILCIRRKTPRRQAISSEQ